MKQEYFTIKKLNDHLTLIKTITGENLYFVQGEKRGILIDTSEGLGPLKPLVDQIAQTNYDVILTHGHIDHAMGAAEFLPDHQVYMNLADRVVYDGMADLQQRKEYAAMSVPKDINLSELDVNPADAVHADDYFNDLTEHKKFDLGGMHIQAISFPGHTPEMTALLLIEDRILITGDGANRSTFMFDQYAPTIHSYRASLERLMAESKARYDRVFISHGPHEVDKNILQNLISLCDDIISRRVDDMPFEFRGQKVAIAKKMSFDTPYLKRDDGVEGNIFYDPSKI